MHYGAEKVDWNSANFVYINKIPGLMPLAKKDVCFDILNR
jgi:hypothetical protein